VISWWAKDIAMERRILVLGNWLDDLCKFSFSTQDGKISGEVSMAPPKGQMHRRSSNENKKEALHKIKLLVEALNAAITDLDK
jgi:hypothetical protein